jgi:hypothetical protein
VLSLPSLRVTRLEIRTRWRRPTTIPGPIVANVLRGALGITLRKLVCPDEWIDNHCPDCPLYQSCAYGQVFMPTPPADAAQLRLQQDLPRPFVVEPPGLHPEDRLTPNGLTFRLMLFGSAIEQLPWLITTLDRLGYDGLGRERVPFQIEAIRSCHPAGDETLFTGGSSAVSLPRRFITTEDIVAAPWPVESRPPSVHSESRQRILARMRQAEAGPASTDLLQDPSRPRLKLRFLTPLLLKSGSGLAADGTRIAAREVRDRPAMGVIIRRLRDRLSSLCTFFGEAWNCPDFAAWGTLADTVTIADSHTTWLTRTRKSTRTGQSHELSGLVGQTTYEFPDERTFETLTPLLRVGELIHVGKNAPWGNGGMNGTLLMERTR